MKTKITFRILIGLAFLILTSLANADDFRHCTDHTANRSRCIYNNRFT